MDNIQGFLGALENFFKFKGSKGFSGMFVNPGQTAYYHLKSSHCLKIFLTQEALVLWYTPLLFNSLLYDISDYNINHSQ